MYYKLLNPNLTHYNFIYKAGLNILNEPFNPDPACGPGALYFSDKDNIFKWVELYNNNPDILIAKVILQSDAQFIEINDYNRKKYKTDKLFIEDIQRLDDFLIAKPDICIEAVKQYGFSLQYVKEQTSEICIEAVKQNGKALQFVKEQTSEICIQAINSNGLALQFVKEQTSEMCMEAVKKNGWALQYVKEQTSELCMEAVKQNSWALQYVKE